MNLWLFGILLIILGSATIIIHEFGHVLAVLIVGATLEKFVVLGKVDGRRVFAAVKYDKLTITDKQQIWIQRGGALLNLPFSFTTFLFIYIDNSDLQICMIFFGIFNFLSFVFNLVPMEVKFLGFHSISDGMHIKNLKKKIKNNK